LSGNYGINSSFINTILPEKSYSSLEILYLDYTQVDQDLDLSKFKKLTCLVLRRCKKLNLLLIRKISESGLVKTLRILDISHNKKLFSEINKKAENELIAFEGEDKFAFYISQLRSLEQLMIIDCVHYQLLKTYILQIQKAFNHSQHKNLEIGFGMGYIM